MSITETDIGEQRWIMDQSCRLIPMRGQNRLYEYEVNINELFYNNTVS